MKNPFRRRVESRQTGPYTDAITTAILAASGQAPEGTEAQTAAVEIAAGVIARGFAAASVDGMDVAPDVLAGIARDMVTRGEAIWIARDGELHSVQTSEITGSVARRTWRYHVDLPSPSGATVRVAAGWERVLHARYSFDPVTPWKGVGPLQRGTLAAGLAANVERTLRDETSGPVGHVLPIPVDGADASVATLKTDLGGLKGRTAIVETTAAGWGDTRAAPRQDFVPQRLGPNPPQGVTAAYSASQLSILAMCGVPVELVAQADGTGQREAWRRCLHGTIQPLGRIIAGELSRIAAKRVEISFEGLFASDIAGRARAFQSLVGAGMSAADAASQSGLIAQEDS